MGSIYKITNNITNKIYIGQTTKKIERRFKEHWYESNVENPKTLIHKAMKKYGIENFSITQIEEVENNKLNEREIYWISYYHSTNKDIGYNLTIGGEGCSLTAPIDYNLIDNLYKNGMSATQIQEKTGYSMHVIYDEIIDKKLNQISHNSKYGYPVAALDIKTKEIIANFTSLTYATQWVIDNNYTTSTKRGNVLSNIRRSINNEARNAYGFKWIKI